VGVDETEGPLLDLGGGPASFFAGFSPNPDQVILLEIDPALAREAKTLRPSMHVVVADGERLPLADGVVRVTVCNSVIEHVPRPDALAAEIRRVSREYFVQTPCESFPLETHSFVGIPFYNSLKSPSLRRLLCRTFGANYGYVSAVRYLTEDRLRTLFPEARIGYEKALGVPKCFYVYRVQGLER